MRKIHSPLSLHRESIRVLDGAQLRRLAGGIEVPRGSIGSDVSSELPGGTSANLDGQCAATYAPSDRCGVITATCPVL